MTPEELRAIGEAIHGKQWKRSLARDVGVTDRTIQRWMTEETFITDRIGNAIKGALYKKIRQLQTALDQV